MEALKASSFTPFHRPLISIAPPTTVFPKPILYNPTFHGNKTSFKAVSPSVPSFFSSDLEVDSKKEDKKFDWYAHWYPVAPICDLDNRRPHGKTVMGIDLVIWFDRNEDAWKVFDDSCPHRLAPLSEGRIDQWGRLQCVYHGWCFGGGGDCKFIPQAPRDGPPIHTSKKACVAVYPSCVQNGILWFWPNSDPEYQGILSKEKPYYIPELDDPTYASRMICRDIPYGYEVLIENLMDPAHVPYAHYGIMRLPKRPDSLKADREGGIPIDKTVQEVDINGFMAQQYPVENHFIAPCIFYGRFVAGLGQSTDKTSTPGIKNETRPQKVALLIFYCVPVSPGNSRLIMSSPRNFAVWPERVVPRWIFHINQNLILDSDLYLLHVEERKLMDVGPVNWNKVCFVPTKSDGLVVAFRKWLNKYSGTQVDWRGKFSGELPPTPPREQLFDRYWSHTVKCSSCNGAYKTLNAGGTVLQVLSICLIGVAAAAKVNVGVRYGMVSAAVLCFVASKCLDHFVHKTFRYHDYDHAFR